MLGKLKKQLALCTVATLFSCQTAFLAPNYDHEDSYNVGVLWAIDAPQVKYYISDENLASLTMHNGRQVVKFKRPGDVYIVASGEGWSQRYLIHINGTNFDEETLDQSAFAEEVLALVNREREKTGAPALSLAEDLQEAAAIRAKELPEQFSHTRPDGSSCFTVIRNQNRELAENIAAGRSTPEDVVAGWMDSPGHRANILNPRLRELGVGYHYEADSRYGHYWVQLFRG